jgi:hypothetical protein
MEQRRTSISDEKGKSLQGRLEFFERNVQTLHSGLRKVFKTHEGEAPSGLGLRFQKGGSAIEPGPAEVMTVSKVLVTTFPHGRWRPADA